MIIQYKIVRKIGELPQIGKGYVKQRIWLSGMVTLQNMTCVPEPAAESLPKVLLFRWKSWQHCMKSLALSWRR